MATTSRYTGLPKIASWIITTKCNMHCLHCYVPSGIGTDELSLEQTKNAIDKIVLLGVKTLVLSGGEPLLKADIADICRYAASKGLYISICTNGSMLSKDMLCVLKKFNLINITVSADGWNAETNDRLRNLQGAFETACRGIKICIENGVDVFVDATVTRLNHDSIHKMIPLCSKLGVSLIMFRRFVPLGTGARNIDRLFISPEEHITSLNRCINEGRKYPDINIVFHDPAFRIFLMKNILKPLYLRYAVSKLWKKLRYPCALTGSTDNNEIFKLRRPGVGCPAGINWFGIMPNGDLRACPLLPIKIGNILQSDPASIWRDSNIIQELKYRRGLKEKCGRCLFKKTCSGCRAYGFSRRSDYLDADTFCSV